MVNGSEAIQVFKLARDDAMPYNLICMDIMMPDIDGHKALKKIREIEKDLGLTEKERVKVIMVSALDDPKNVVKSYQHGGAESYIVKPIKKEKLLEEVRKLSLIQ